MRKHICINILLLFNKNMFYLHKETFFEEFLEKNLRQRYFLSKKDMFNSKLTKRYIF